MLGLTLEGGGAKGAYHIGAWKAFRELEIDFDGITGTSVGALNGGMMIQGDFDEAWQLWEDMNPQKVMALDDEIYEMLSDGKLDHGNVFHLMEEMRKIIKNSGIDNSPMYDTINQLLHEDRIRKSPKDFGFVTFSITDRKPLELFKEDIPPGKMGDYLMASSFLPIFKERLLDGKSFIDGAFYNNLPANMLVRKGYRVIYAVRLYSAGRIIKIDPQDAQVHYIAPERYLGGILDFNQERIRRNMHLGYFDTMKKMKNLEGRFYYLEDFPEEADALSIFLKMPDNAQREVCQILGLNSAKSLNRLFLEDAIPELVKLAGMEETDGYRDLLLRVLEAIAEACGVSYLKIYSFNEWIQSICTCPLEQRQENEDSGLTALIRISESLFKMGKEKKKEQLLKWFMHHRDWLLKAT